MNEQMDTATIAIAIAIDVAYQIPQNMNDSERFKLSFASHSRHLKRYVLLEQVTGWRIVVRYVHQWKKSLRRRLFNSRSHV